MMSFVDGAVSGAHVVGGGKLPTRDRLTGAFMRLVQQRGFAAVGTTEILQAAAAPRGSLYHHFPAGKSALAVAAIEALAADITGALQRAGDGKRPLASLLRQMATARAGWLKRTGWSEGPLLTVLANEVVPHEPDIADALKQAGDAVTDAFTDLFVARGFATAQARRHAHMTRSVLDGAMTIARAARSVEALTEAGDFLARQFANPDSTGS